LDKNTGGRTAAVVNFAIKGLREVFAGSGQSSYHDTVLGRLRKLSAVKDTRAQREG